MLHVGIGDDRSIPVGDDDIFVTTSWWTTAPIVGAIGHKRVVYLLQEDERMFYSRGYERLRCSEVIADERLHTLVNTELLFRYLADGPNRSQVSAPEQRLSSRHFRTRSSMTILVSGCGPGS